MAQTGTDASPSSPPATGPGAEPIFAENCCRAGLTFNPADNPWQASEHDVTIAQSLTLAGGILDVWHSKNFYANEFDSARDRLHDPGILSRLTPLSHRLYRRMRPALRLATQFVERCRPAFYRIVHAPIAPDFSHLTDHYTVTHEGHRRLDEYLAELAQHSYFFYFPEDGRRRLTFAVTGGNIFARDTLYPTPVGINRAFYLVFGDTYWNGRPLYHRDSVCVQFAKTMVHELAHMLYRYRVWRAWRDDHRQRHIFVRQQVEPALWPQDPTPELGRSIERYLWGAWIRLTEKDPPLQPPSPPPPQSDSTPGGLFAVQYDGSLGLFLRYGPDDGWEANPRSQFAYLTPETLASLFRIETWEAVDDTDRTSTGERALARIPLVVLHNPIRLPRTLAHTVGTMDARRGYIESLDQYCNNDDGFHPGGFTYNQHRRGIREAEVAQRRRIGRPPLEPTPGLFTPLPVASRAQTVGPGGSSTPNQSPNPALNQQLPPGRPAAVNPNRHRHPIGPDRDRQRQRRMWPDLSSTQPRPEQGPDQQPGPGS